MTELGGRAAAAASGPPASRAGSSRAARSTSACSSRTRRRRPARRASPARARSRRRCCCAASACELDGIRAVVVNSGNANAATGRPGSRTRPRCRARRRSPPASAPESAVAVASTGVIGVPLPIDRSSSGIARATHALRAGRRGRLRRTRSGRPTRSTSTPASTSRSAAATVRLTAQAKGAGMISPRFATLLCFVQTDAALSPETCDLLLGVTVKRSFERVSVDGQLSTVRHRDPPVQRRVRRADRARDRGRAALRRGARRGAAPARARGRRATARARGGSAAWSSAAATRRRSTSASRARSPNSPLVKTALYGGDPNWGRIVQAVGMATARHRAAAVDIAIEGIQVCAPRRVRPARRPTR